ncbi:MAG: methionine--tRNA ligase subunit beta, partial [Sulfurovaceae bacterium]|nr:methionine--tRNA ligase subunit beta [Sulfurovaceae bacterium]
GMSGKYFEGRVECDLVSKYYQAELDEMQVSLDKLEPMFFELQLHKYLEELWRPLTVANRAIDRYQPWTMIKEGKTEETMALNGLIATILAKVSLMLHAVMPKTTSTICKDLGFEITPESFERIIRNGGILEPFVTAKREPLFPRIEEQILVEKKPVVEEKAKKIKKEKSTSTGSVTTGIALIGIDQFFETSLKIGTIVSAEEVPKSKKLLLLQVDIGEETPRQVVAGIKEWYSAEELVGTQACVVANLKPAKLMGMKSEGMLLAAKDSDGLCLIRPEKPKNIGTPIS